MSAIIKDKHSDRNSALLYAKDLLLERATQASRGAFSAQGTSSEEAAAFLRRYYRHVAADDLVGRSAEEVLETALSHRSVAGHRPQGTAAVRVSTPEGEGHSLVEV
ncbi:MAG: hypothetical protein ACRDV2_15420, partial [Actinomycetes bacterium]